MNLQVLEDKSIKVVEWIRKWGGLNTDALLDPLCQLFSTPEIEGLIGYRIACNYVIVFGEPVCEADKKIQFAQAFQCHCKKLNLPFIYVMVSKEFKEKMNPFLCPIALEFGKEMILDPQINRGDQKGSKKRLIRKKMRYALKENVKISEYIGSDSKIEEGIQQVGVEWLKKRKGPQIHISSIRLFEDRLGKRWFYAEVEKKIVGFLILNQLEEKSSWLLNNLMMGSAAPQGTSELLIISTLEEVKKESHTLVSIGPIPSENLGEIKGLSRFSTWLMEKTFKIAKKVFRLDAQRIFWNKFEPTLEPSYLLFSQNTIRLKAVLAIMRAMNATSY